MVSVDVDCFLCIAWALKRISWSTVSDSERGMACVGNHSDSVFNCSAYKTESTHAFGKSMVGLLLSSSPC